MEYGELPYDQLRVLHQNIGALLAERRHEAVEQLKQQASVLGVELKELIPKKTRGRPRKGDDQ